MKLKQILQNLLDTANWYGYATRNNKKYSTYKINRIAERAKIQLTYNCPS